MSWNTFATVAETKLALDEKKVSAVELATHYLARADALNPTLNAYITLDREKTLAEASAADARRASGDAAPLLGVPIAHKDIYLIDGWRTTCGSRMLENFVAPYTSTVVKYMADAGMVTLGKLNMDEFAMGSSNETSYFGTVKNPWDLSRVPGGSSGGSAAAVAAERAPTFQDLLENRSKQLQATAAQVDQVLDARAHEGRRAGIEFEAVARRIAGRTKEASRIVDEAEGMQNTHAA